QAAKEGADGEHGDAGHVEAFAADAVGDPSADGQDDGVGDKVGGENPGGFLESSAEGSCNVRQGDVGDAGVERLHKGGERNGKGDDPRVVSRRPVLVMKFAVGDRKS